MAEQVGEPPTVAADVSFSQPSTSTAHGNVTMRDAEADMEKESDSDASIDWDEYERRKDVLIKKLVLCEQAMGKIKVTAKHTRLKDWEKRREEIMAGTDSEFVARCTALQKEMERIQDECEVRFVLSIDSLERAREGEEDFIERGYRDRKQYKKSQLLYDNKLKQYELLRRICKEDCVRADARIFVGEDVPDAWLDEFVKEYVDEMEARENSPEAVRKRKMAGYRREAGESLDLDQPLDRLSLNEDRHWSSRSLQPRPGWMYKKKEKKRKERDREKEREEQIEKALKNISNRRLARFFGNKRLFPRPVTPVKLVAQEEEEDLSDEGMSEEEEEEEEEREEKMEPEVIQIDDDDDEEDEEVEVQEVPRPVVAAARAAPPTGDGGSRSREDEEIRLQIVQRLEQKRIQDEEEAAERERFEQARQERWRMMEDETSGESGSDPERDPVESMRRSVRAVVLSHQKPATAWTARHSRREGRLKASLRNALRMREELSEDPQLQPARHELMLQPVGGAKIQPPRGSNPMVNLEEECRDSSLVRGLVRRSLALPMPGGGWIDEGGAARRAVKRQRRSKGQLNVRFSATRRRQFDVLKRKRRKVNDDGSSSGWETEEEKKEEDEEIDEVDPRQLRRGGRGSPLRVNGHGEEEEEEGEGEGGERMEESRRVIKVRDKDERTRVDVEQWKRKKEQRREDRRRGGPALDYGSDSDEEYGSNEKSQMAPMIALPQQRKAIPPPDQPMLQLQLSEQRLLQDLFRSGALRERETADEYAARMEREKKQRLLASLPSTSSGRARAGQDRSRAGGAELRQLQRSHLLSPRSQEALEEFPEESLTMLTRKERDSILKGLGLAAANDAYRSSADSQSDEEEEKDEEEEEEPSEEYIVDVEEELRREEEIREEEEEEEEMEVVEVDNAPAAGRPAAVAREGDEKGKKKKATTPPETPREEEKKEEERGGASPIRRDLASPILMESAAASAAAAAAATNSKRKKSKQSVPKMNGFPARTGTATVS